MARRKGARECSHPQQKERRQPPSHASPLLSFCSKDSGLIGFIGFRGLGLEGLRGLGAWGLRGFRGFPGFRGFRGFRWFRGFRGFRSLGFRVRVYGVVSGVRVSEGKNCGRGRTSRVRSLRKVIQGPE